MKVLKGTLKRLKENAPNLIIVYNIEKDVIFADHKTFYPNYDNENFKTIDAWRVGVDVNKEYLIKMFSDWLQGKLIF